MRLPTYSISPTSHRVFNWTFKSLEVALVLTSLEPHTIRSFDHPGIARAAHAPSDCAFTMSFNAPGFFTQQMELDLATDEHADGLPELRQRYKRLVEMLDYKLAKVNPKLFSDGRRPR